MSDLSYTVEIRGADDLDRLAGTVGKLTQALDGTKGAGKHLTELRNALNDLKAAGAGLEQLQQSVSKLDDTLRSEFAMLRSVVQTELTKVALTMSTAGLAAGAALEDNLKKGMKGATAQIKEEGEKAAATAAAASKSIAVAMNNAQGAYTRYSSSSGLAGGVSPVDKMMKDVVTLEKAMDKQVKVDSLFVQGQEKAVAARRAAREQLVAEGRKQQLAEALLREKGKDEQLRFVAMQSELHEKEVADRRTAREKLVAEGRKQQLAEALLREKGKDEQLRFVTMQAELREKEVADRRTAREKLVAEGRKQQLAEALLREKGKDEQLRFVTMQAELREKEVADRRTAREKLVAEGRKQQMVEALLREKSKDEQLRFVTMQSELREKEVAARRTAREKLVAEGRKQQMAEALLREKSKDEQLRFVTLQAELHEKEVADRRAAREKLVAEGRKQQMAEAQLRQKSMDEQLRFLSMQEKLRKESMYASAARQVAAASNAPVGAYQVYNPTTGVAGGLRNVVKEQGEAAAGAAKLNQAFKALTISGNDTHSMARGLASGFNLLWLTWGNLAPLFAGAAISFGVRKTFDIGSEIEYNIKMMEMLGQSTEAQAGTIRQAWRDIDQTTQFSLLELSKAQVQLGQAGFSVKEGLEILRPAADLASLGMVDLKTSTDLLIQTMALFGKTSQDSGKLAAQIFEATKSGVLNVEDIYGSMKYASEANTRFGKSVEETLALLNTLAEAGLKSSSGGTAFINFLRDLNGRSGPAIKALNDLSKATGASIKAFNDDGSQRTAVEMFTDIYEAAKKLKSEDADKLLAKIFSDRGGRTFYAMVREGNVDIQKLVDTLKNVDTDAFFKNAQGLMDTTKGAFDQLRGAMVGALDTTFERYQGQFKQAVQDMTGFINSAEFQASLNTMVGGVMGLYEAVKTLGPALMVAASAYVTFKTAALGASAFAAIQAAGAGAILTLTGFAQSVRSAGGFVQYFTSATATSSATLLGNVAATRAAAAGMDAAGVAAARSAAQITAAGAAARIAGGFLAFLANPLVGLVTTLGILGYTFWTTSNSAKEASESLSDRVIKDGKVNIAQWDKEIAKLKERAALVNAGRYADAYDAINQARKAKDAAQDSWQAAQANVDRLDSRKDLQPEQRDHLRRTLEKYANDRLAEFSEATSNFNQMQSDIGRMMEEDDRAQAERIKREQAKVNGLFGNPTGLDLPTNPNPASPRTPPVYRTWYDENFETFKQITDAQGAYMKTMYDQGKVNVDEYYDYLMGKASMTAELEREHLLEQIKVFSADPKSSKAAKEASAKLAALELKTEAEKVELAAQYNKAQQENLSIQQQIALFSKNYNEKLRGDGTDIMSIQRGGAAVEAYRAELQVRQDFLKERERIEKDFAKNSIGLAEEGLETQRALMQTALDDLRTKEATALQIVRDHETLKTQERMNPLNGVRSALEDYAHQAQDLAGLTKTATSSMLTNLEDAFVRLATTGKVSFSDMANSIMADLARIAIRQASLGLMGQALGALGSFMGGGFNIAAGVQASGAVTSPVHGASAAPYTSLAPLPNAKGNVFMNSPSLSSFSNQVHDRPQLFAFAKGAGIFGEAGPEAIMPLTRGADGNLGVRAHGGETNVNIEIVNNGSPVQATTTQSTAPDGTKLVKVVLEAVAGDVRGRGKIYQAIKQTV